MKVLLNISILLFIIPHMCLGQTNDTKQGGELLAQFVKMPIASGQFTQRKYFKALKHPILSRGEVYLEENLGLLWQTNSPVFSRILLKNSGLYSDDGVSPEKRIRGGDIIAKVIMHAILGDISSLEQQFKVDSTKTESCTVLTPKDKQLASAIRSIELCSKQIIEESKPSNHDIEQIVLFEHSGNRTEIELAIAPQKMLPEVVRAQLK